MPILALDSARKSKKVIIEKAVRMEIRTRVSKEMKRNQWGEVLVRIKVKKDN